MPSLDLSPDQVSAARASWVAAGNSAEQFDRALSGAPEPEPTPAVEPDQGPAFSSEEIKSARDGWIKAGLPVEDFDQALAADGIDAPAEPVSPDIAANLAEHALEPDHIAPTDYKIDWLSAGPARELSTAELVALNAQATSMLSDMHIDPGLGAGFIEHAICNAYAYDKMSEPERGLWRSGEAYKCKGGIEEYEAQQKQAKDALLKLSGDHPFAVKLANNPAVIGDVWVQKTILHHAEKVAAALAARTKSKAK